MMNSGGRFDQDSLHNIGEKIETAKEMFKSTNQLPLFTRSIRSSLNCPFKILLTSCCENQPSNILAHSKHILY